MSYTSLSLPLSLSFDIAHNSVDSTSHAHSLRSYQIEAIDALSRGFAHGSRFVVVCLATGTGKTVVASEFVIRELRNSARSGERAQVLWVTHQNELLAQAAESFSRQAPDLRQGWEQGSSYAQCDHDIIFSTIQSLQKRRLDTFLKEIGPTLRYVVIDEAHRSAAFSYRTLLGKLRDLFPSVRGIGLTATPNRTDKICLADIYDDIVYSYPVDQAIRDGWLVEPRGYRVQTKTSLDAVAENSKSRFDFDETLLAKEINTLDRNNEMVKAWRSHALDKKTLVFCVDVHHAEDVAKAFISHGISALSLYGSLPIEERKRRLALFKERKILVLCGVNLFVEGFDDPGVEAGIFGRPTKSSLYYQQSLGRVIRPDVVSAKEISSMTNAAIRASFLRYSWKPFAIIIDMIDQLSKCEIVSISSLFGPKQFEVGSLVKKITSETKQEMIPILGQITREHQHKDGSLTHETIISSFDIFKENASLESCLNDGEQSTFCWAKVRPGCQRLLLPRQYIGIDKDGNRSAAFTMALEAHYRDQDPVYSASRVVPGMHPLSVDIALEIECIGENNWRVQYLIQDHKKIKDTLIEHVGIAETAQAAVSLAERSLRTDYPSLSIFIDKTAKWRSYPPSEAQRRIIEKAGLTVPKTRSEAHDILATILSRKSKPSNYVARLKKKAKKAKKTPKNLEKRNTSK